MMFLLLLVVVFLAALGLVVGVLVAITAPVRKRSHDDD